MTLVFATIAVWSLAIDVVLGVEPISLDGFRDGAKHWKNGQNVDGYPVYRPEQAKEIAENLLLYQRANGGWPKDFDPARILSESEVRELADTRAKEDTSFDNRSTYPEVEYLAQAYKRLGDGRYREASLRGIEFILKAQYPNGGWPHSYPSRKSYYPHITMLDDVMVGVLSAGAQHGNKAQYDFVPAELRRRVNDARERGDACLLKLQLRVDGKLTGWASQYDEVTLQPCDGRTFEPAGLASAESVGALKYLMHLDAPSPAVRQAIESGMAWLDRSKVEHLRIERVPAETVRFRTPHQSVRPGGGRGRRGPAALGSLLRDRNESAVYGQSRRQESLPAGRCRARASHRLFVVWRLRQGFAGERLSSLCSAGRQWLTPSTA